MLAEGQTIGNYRVLRKLGEGGMGAVFEAQHVEIGRKAAIKVLHPQFAQNAQVAMRFLNEAKAANLIEHPGVVEIFEFSRLPDGTTYIVMEFLKGESLAKRLERGPIGLDALRIARQIGSVLVAAHEHGIIHRDLKPDNVIMVRDPEAPGGERAKVLDFGIAKIAEEQVFKTQAGSILGTPAYMAPEQCRGATEVTDKSDVYALGIMLYEMLCGRPPFTNAGVGEIMIMQMSKQPPPLRELSPAVPQELADFVHRTLAKDPKARPTMRQVVDAVEQLGALRTGPMPVVTAEPSGRNFTAPRPISHAGADAKTLMATDAAAVSAMPPRTIALPDAPPQNSPAVQRTLALPDPGPRPSTAVIADPLQSGSGLDDRKRLFILIGAVLAGLVVIGVIIGVVKKSKGPGKRRSNQDMGSNADAGGKNNPNRKRPEARRPKVPIPEGMVFIPGGRFEMGSTASEMDAAMKLCQERGIACKRTLYEREQPKRSVTIADLFMDQTEVTNSAFASWLNEQSDLKIQKKRFVSDDKGLLLDLSEAWSGITTSVAAGKLKPDSFKTRDGFSDKPVVLVSWRAAQRFCAAQNKRLPSEAEWELAARGLERATFPWGEEPARCDQMTFGRSTELPEDRRCTGQPRGPSNVGTSLQDRTVQHALDLAGNVSEWVQDRFADTYPACRASCANPVNDIADAGNGDAADSQADAKADTKTKGGKTKASKAKSGKADKGSKGSKAAAVAGVMRVVRGGNFDLAADACRGAGRSRLSQDEVSINIGFRCVRPLSQ
ncbi:MAG: SUMF1/EgtB/PvdO family nonheme iron enzyme [Myxococcales bacterium]|nr:SUMF1/EgtB/PvdO family nonheme iron enzyme [Myxococcales bacterium]